VVQLANCEGGRTPRFLTRKLNLLFLPGQLGLRRLGELGVCRVSCGSLLFRVALHAAVTTLSQIREGDPVETPGIPSYAEIQALVPGGS